MSEQWYVLRSKPHKEFPLFDQVLTHRIECFFPRLKVNPVNPRSAKLRPYFPNYMFVRTDLSRVGENCFRWMPFAHGLVSFGGKPASVPDHLIAALERRVEDIQADGGLDFNGFEPGVEVQVINGPFSGYSGLLDTRLEGRERVRILLQVLKNRQVPVDLHVGQIQLKNK